MAGYNYSQYIEAISSALESPITDSTSATPFVNASYNQWLPRAIEAGEQRIYRELDLLGTRMVDTTGSFAANSKRFTLPTSEGAFIVVEQVQAVNPTGTANQMLPVSKEYLDAAWPTDIPAFTPSVPMIWSPFDQSSIFIAPPPDQICNAVVIGTIRPNPLSSSNITTILTDYLPDLFLAVSMVSWIGLQRDYGQASDDPKLAVSWESNYQIAKQSAAVEQFRIRFASQGWGCRLPSPVASPPQT